MNSVTSSLTTYQIGGLPQGECQQCGATDKKLSPCAQCHIEQYCSRVCQVADWQNHRFICYPNSKEKDMTAGHISEVAEWCGKKFGELRGFKSIDQDIRILSHTGGFAVFLPKEIWRLLDHQIPISFPENDHSSCWIAEKEFAFLKVDLTLSKLKDSDIDYASADIEVALNKVERFVRRNFIDNVRSRPDRICFTHGSYKVLPNIPRPYRFQTTENFYYQF